MNGHSSEARNFKNDIGSCCYVNAVFQVTAYMMDVITYKCLVEKADKPN